MTARRVLRRALVVGVAGVAGCLAAFGYLVRLAELIDDAGDV